MAYGFGGLVLSVPVYSAVVLTGNNCRYISETIAVDCLLLVGGCMGSFAVHVRAASAGHKQHP